ncbi:hypothetical protein STCU_11471 [Strigomonas culicis]|uniref:Uncharacterized protein n=1 Tax=Strigomonas culicis TaxID=28005 RepID=S9TIM7_9TRYP|nr:hypothetical protein STCU_11471 [Strigomonas culicis]|eukprot:EPY16213.1 hypothetical protein STCU_11471 [Strigomonas culicis]
MLEEALVTSRGSLPVRRALLHALDALKADMRPPQVVDAATLLLNTACHPSLAAEARRFILRCLYAHAAEARGHVGLRFLQVLARVPRPAGRADSPEEALRRSTWSRCLCHHVQGSGKPYTSHLGGLQVTQVVQDAVTLCHAEMDPLVLLATLEWLAARRQRERKGLARSLPLYLHALQSELRSGERIGRKGRWLAVKLRRHSRDTNYFEVPHYDASTLSQMSDTDPVGAPSEVSGADTVTSITKFLRELPRLQGTAYLLGISRVHQFLLRCATAEEVRRLAPSLRGLSRRSACVCWNDTWPSC